MRPTLLVYCQSSLGLGHLSRSFALSEALSRHFRVVLLCGGKPPQGIEPPDGVMLVQLPPMGSEIGGELVSHDGRRSLERAHKLRREIILKTFRSVKPDMVLIEFFPFGKKRFAREIVPLLEEARGLGSERPLIVCSIRDILVSRGPEQQEHDDAASELCNRFFDAVLVHSDPRFASFEESFKPLVPLRIPTFYTGFVVGNGHSHNGSNGRGREIVVSAGGGTVGEPLIRAAVGASRLLSDEDVSIKVIAGPLFPERAWHSLRAEANGNRKLTLRRSVPNLFEELRTATASVSQCGYNTALEIVQAEIPALVVPFAEEGEDEQTKRAHRLEELGAVRVLEPDALNPSTLADEIRSLLRFRPRRVAVDLEGGPNSIQILAELHAARLNGSTNEIGGR